MSEQLNAVIVEPKSSHKSSIIWLHGLGANGHDFEPVVPELKLPAKSGIRFIFPHAPVRPVTINGGMVMRAWYDVRNTDLRKQEDSQSIHQSSQLINQYIQQEIDSGIPANRIILAGFSQGGAIALHCGLRYPDKLAGLLVLSSYLPLPEIFSDQANKPEQCPPILMLHGEYDPVIPVDSGETSAEFLQNHGFQVDWRTYHMDHAVCLEEIRDIGMWIQERLN